MTTPKRSLRRTLLVRLIGPLALVTMLAGAMAFVGARHFSAAVLDQWLYDAATSIANRVHRDDQRLRIDPSGALDAVDTDIVDRLFYEVATSQGERIAGNASLPTPPQPMEAGTRQVYWGFMNATPVRVLAIRVRRDGAPIVVKVAETLQKRTTLARQLLWLALGLSAMLAAVAAGVIWYGIGRGIAATESAMRNARRGAGATLAPLELTPDMPVEVVPLIAQINALIEQLSVSHRVNERFIMNAAHQLRTPVATLRVQLEAASRIQDPRRRLEHVNDAVQAVTHMSRVLHQLLTLAQADDSATRPQREAGVDIVRMARDEVAARLDDAVALGVDLGYEGPREPVRVAGTPGLVSEALANLLDNALRYGAAGGVVTVGVTTAPVPTLYVEDRGPGIPEDERARVTHRFYRMPGTPGNGCGLGLAIVEEIARSSGASLELATGADDVGLRASLRFTPTPSGAAKKERAPPAPQWEPRIDASPANEERESPIPSRS